MSLLNSFIKEKMASVSSRKKGDADGNSTGLPQLIVGAHPNKPTLSGKQCESKVYTTLTYQT